MEDARTVLIRYLQDAVAAESNFESQLRALSQEGDIDEVKELFREHAEQTRTQHLRLTRRLEQLGGTTSTVKSIFAHLLQGAAKVVQLGQEKADRLTQNLIMAFAVENCEVAMYEAMAIAAARAGDIETEQLAREIQAEEQEAAEKVWMALLGTAELAADKISGGVANF